MKSIFRALLIGSVLIAIVSFADDKPEVVYSLTVEVKELRNSEGVVQFGLYNRTGSIPDEHCEKYYRLLKTEIKNGAARVIFRDLPAGKYAVNVIHDENRNGRIDKGILLPKEGIGFSNFASIGLRNKPSFEKASFLLHADTSIAVKIIYM